MATVVTTLLYVPAAVLLGGLCFLVGMSIWSLLTLGGALHPDVGLIAWLAIFFVPVVV